MGRKKKLSLEDCITALKETRGTIALAAEKLGVSFPTVNAMVEAHPELKAIIMTFRQRRGDIAELAFEKALAEGQPWAVALALRTLRKEHYTTREEVTGADGGPIEVKIVWDDSTK